MKLRQVLINLINNGIKFTSEGGVFVSVTRQESPLDPALNQEVLLISVKDTGIGIAKTEIEKLFQAFVQTQSGKQSQEGTGLGLAISRKFVQLMGGDIQSEVSSVVSVSLGIASLIPNTAIAPEYLISLADRALYEAKAQGRDRLVTVQG
ncbi:MAG: ATP-binding protein [Oscillatoria sp. PMC 1068.18]|nr:ATP-binding protein [Oscillatoria sp. PMC 1076.18]MEC4991468.1 ATP-binding protein [Oscillatoria sp. PMC 1068.18]